MNKLLFIIIVAIVLSGCYESDYSNYNFKVVYIYDGDTVKLSNGEKVRYIGIDTPEMNYNNPPAEYFAQEAKEYNAKLVLGKKVKLEFDVVKRDKYGRLLAYVYIDGKHISQEMIEHGYAKVLMIPPNLKFADYFLTLQNLAKEEKRGIWSK